MNILAFDNSSSNCVVAIKSGAKSYFLAQNAPMQQAKLILPMIDELLSEAKLKLTDIDLIAYGAGPGSFTGIRIASSVAQGLGFGADIPLLPLSSLALLAQATFLDKNVRDIYVAVDARMEQVYFAHFHVDDQDNLRLQHNEILTTPSTVKFSYNQGCGVGNGWLVYEAQFASQPTELHPDQVITGKALLTLAECSFLPNKTVLAGAAIPVYLR